MGIWDALDQGARSFQRGHDWGQQAVLRGAQVREVREEQRVNEMDAALRQEQSQQAQAPQQLAENAARSSALTPEVNPQALTPATPTPQVQGDATDPDAASILQASQELRQIYFPQSAPATGGGQPQPNMDAIRDMITGQGQLPPNVLERAARNASGNQEGPLGRRDFVAYMGEMERRMNAAGLGHRAEAWRGRALQQFQSAASRTMALAATAAQGGDMDTAARLATRAYGFVPDGAQATVQRDAQGNYVAVRTDAQGQPTGQPMPLNPQTLREMAIQVADPGAMETLLLQREDRALGRDRLAETVRHNQAAEGIAAMRAARSGSGGTGRETSLSVAERRAAYADVDEALGGYEAAAAERPGSMGATGPSRLGGEQVRGVAQSLVEAGVPGAEAARIARAIGMRQANPLMQGDQRIGVEIGGRQIQLPGSTMRLLEQYGGGGAPQRAAPTHAGRNAIRQQQAP